MNIERPSHSNPEQTEFLLDIIDDRHRTLNLLKDNYTESDTQTAGYYGHAKLPPALADFADITHPIDVVINSAIERTQDPDNQTYTAHLTVIPEDRRAFTLNDEQRLVTIDQGGTSLTDGDCLRDTLKGLFADGDNCDKLEQLSDLQMLDIILSLSPDTRRYHKFEHITDDAKVTIEAISAETEEDSIDSLTIETLRPHASGALVGTRLTVRESLKDRLDEPSLTTNHSVDIIARYNELATQDVLTVEQLLEDQSRFVPVQAITHYHMSDVYDALAVLNKYGLDSSNSGRA